MHILAYVTHDEGVTRAHGAFWENEFEFLRKNIMFLLTFAALT
jgi:hypothetical protein